jgi:putative endonuclease
LPCPHYGLAQTDDLEISVILSDDVRSFRTEESKDALRYSIPGALFDSLSDGAYEVAQSDSWALKELQIIQKNDVPEMPRAWVYILLCSDERYYVGCTSNLSQRVAQHNEGFFDGYTAYRRPVKLLWSHEFQSISEAIAAERQIKGWTRAKKAALMNGDFDLLHKLAESTSTKSKKANNSQ